MFDLYKKGNNRKLIILISFFFMVFGFIWLEFFVQYPETKSANDGNNIKKFDTKTLEISADPEVSGNWTELIAAGLCTGSGTFSNPYIIKDLVLIGNGTGTGIGIGANLYDYFRIENCTISNYQIGIELFNSNNGTLYRNNLSHNGFGIYMNGFLTAHYTQEQFKYIGCMNNTILENILNNNNHSGIHLYRWGDDNKIIGNIVNNNRKGIYLEGSAFHKNEISENIINRNEIGIEVRAPGNISIISGNILNQNKEFGIKLQYVGFNLTQNTMVGSGLGFYETTIEGMSLNYIDTTNTVNGRLIYNYINETNLNPSDFSNAGQIILVNCSNSFIRDANLSYSSKGLSISHSKNAKILNCDSSNNYVGITLWNTNNSILEGCIFNNNIYGIEARPYSKNNTIIRSSINNNSWYGIKIDFYCDNYWILDSELVNNNIALSLRLSSYNTIVCNVLKNNSYGIYVMGGSEYNIFYENFFRGNTYHTNGGSTTNSWNSSHIGNYWDTYIGFDDDGDGIGEFPHIIIESPLILDYLPIVDNDPPIMIVYSPKNDESYAYTAPSFSISIIDKYLYKMWYTFDDGIHNYFFTENNSINQEVWDILPQGLNTLRFYASDKAGNIIFKEITIYKSIPNLIYIQIIIYSTVIGIVSIIAIGALLLYRRKFKLKE